MICWERYGNNNWIKEVVNWYVFKRFQKFKTKIDNVSIVSYISQGPSWSCFVWKLDLLLAVQSVPITIKGVSSNPVHGEVDSIQQYMIKFVGDLRQVGGFIRVLWFPPPINLTATI
jgi:hypothetical protein